MSGKISFANELAHRDLGTTAASIMTDCERYGMSYGCDVDCPVLLAGECELQGNENKELYKEAMIEHG